MTSGAIYPDLAGRTVFISGGGSGIGAAMVRAFVAQHCHVAFVDIDDTASLALIADIASSRVRYGHCDVRDVGALQAEMASVAAVFGPINVLVNNAARDDRHRLKDVTPEFWEENMAVNLRHHVFAAQAVAPAMAAAGGGAIVNMGSVSWMTGGPAMVCYTTAKAAISGMTRVLARELGVHNIRVNALLPGAVVTQRQRALWSPPQTDAMFLAQQCLKFRLVEEDIARAALFLASDESRGMTGHSMVVDAGIAQTSSMF